MEIVRIPKGPNGATVARLAISKTFSGGVQAILRIESPMSVFMERGEYESFEQAESSALARAEQHGAACLIVEDRT